MVFAPADPAAELVELGEAESIGAFDDHNGGIRNVHADFNYRSGNQNVGFAFLKGFHDIVFFPAFHFSVQHDNFQVWKNFSGQLFKFFLNGFQFQSFPLCFGDDLSFINLSRFDARTDDKRLPTFLNLLTDEVIRFFPVFRGNDFSDNFFPAGRQFGDGGKIQVSENGEGECPRYRSRGH